MATRVIISSLLRRFGRKVPEGGNGESSNRSDHAATLFRVPWLSSRDDGAGGDASAGRRGPGAGRNRHFAESIGCDPGRGQRTRGVSRPHRGGEVRGA